MACVARYIRRVGRFVALLRGINVGGKNKLPMRVLMDFFERAAVEDVDTYIQSGNVVFSAAQPRVKAAIASVEGMIRDEVGLDVPIVLRSAKQIGTMVDANPFAGQPIEHLHVGFLQKAPTAAKAKSLDPGRSPGDEFALVGSHIYFRCPNGLARTKLTTQYFDSRLDVVMTVRNWKTVNKLVAMLGD